MRRIRAAVVGLPLPVLFLFFFFLSDFFFFFLGGSLGLFERLLLRLKRGV